MSSSHTKTKHREQSWPMEMAATAKKEKLGLFWQFKIEMNTEYRKGWFHYSRQIPLNLEDVQNTWPGTTEKEVRLINAIGAEIIGGVASPNYRYVAASEVIFCNPEFKSYDHWWLRWLPMNPKPFSSDVDN